MKKMWKTSICLLMAIMMLFVLVGCPTDPDDSGGGDTTDVDTRLRSLTVNDVSATLGTPGNSPEGIGRAGSVSLSVSGDDLIVEDPAIVARAREGAASVEFAKGTETAPGAFSGTAPTSFENGDYLWVKVTLEGVSSYYKIKVNIGKVTPGFGVPDPAFVAKYPYFVFPNLAADEILTEAKLPEPSYWNTLATEPGLIGHMHAYPDPFHFANGNRVVTLQDWANRKKEMQLLISYYGKGHIPSIDPSVVDIWVSGAQNRTITIRYKGTTRTASFTPTVTNNTELTVAGNEGKLYFGGSASTANKTLGGASNPVAYVSRTAIATLYGISADNITRDSATAWTASVLLTAIEGTDDPMTDGGPRQANTTYFYPISMVGTPTEGAPDQSWFTTEGPLYSSGYSTGGKQSMAHTMAMGRQGSNFGHSDIGDSGAGGAAIERFNTAAGLRLDITLGEALSYSGYTEAQVIALGLDPSLKNPIKNADDTPYGWPVPIAPIKHIGAITRTTPGSLGGYEDLLGVPYYTYGLQSGRTWPIGDGFPSWGGAGDSGGTGRLRVVRGWAPYWEEFDHVPNSAQNFGTTPTGNWANAKTPYVPWQHTVTQQWSGIQQWMQGRDEDGANRYWFGDVWRQFNDFHFGLNLDRVANQPTRDPQGFGCAMPFDTYFEIMLNAPHGVTYIRSGVGQMRTNQPSMWANWLLNDEVYKFFGEQEWFEEHGTITEDPDYPGSGLYMGWDKYIWRNASFFAWGQHGENTTEETASNTALLGIVRSGNATTEYAKANFQLAKLRDSMFPVDDPVYYLGEWHKFDWGRPRPGGTAGVTIAERVRRRVEPILKDYFMGETFHEVPSSVNTAETYHDAAKAGYTPTGPKFKRMDWKGLTDNPENM